MAMARGYAMARRRHALVFFLFFPENMFSHFMQIGNNLHEMSNPVFWGKIRKLLVCRRLILPRE